MQADVSEPEHEEFIRATLARQTRILTVQLAIVDSLLELLVANLVNEGYPLLARLEAVQGVLEEVLVEGLALDADVEEHEDDAEYGCDQGEEEGVGGLFVFEGLAEVEDFVANQDLQYNHGNRLEAQLDDASLDFEALTLLLMQTKDPLDQTQEEILDALIALLSAEKAQKRKDVHYLVGNLDQNEVEGADEAQEQQSEENHAIALSPDLCGLVHAIVQQHVDDGAVGYEEAGADGNEHDQHSDLVGVLVNVFRLHALPIYLVEQHHIRKQVQPLHYRSLNLLDDCEHIRVLLLLNLLILIQLLQLPLHHLAPNAPAAALEALAEDAVEEAVVLVVVEAVAHLVEVDLHHVEEVFEIDGVYIKHLKGFKYLLKGLLIGDLASVLGIWQIEDDLPDSLRLIVLNIAIIILV